jgi:hypothetical protein
MNMHGQKFAAKMSRNPGYSSPESQNNSENQVLNADPGFIVRNNNLKTREIEFLARWIYTRPISETSMQSAINQLNDAMLPI